MMYLRAAVISAIFPLSFACLGLIAWTTGFLRLASVTDAYIPMAPSTAIGFLLIGGAIVSLAHRREDPVRIRARLAAALLSILAIIKLVEFFVNNPLLNLEAALVANPGEFGAVPLARMSPLTAVSFLLSGASLAMLTAAPKALSHHAAGVLGAIVALGGATVALGYAFGAPLLYGGRVIPMALTTGIAFIGTGLALIALAGPASLPLATFCGNSARARLLRVFLPLTVGMVLVNRVLSHVILSRVDANPGLLSALFALASALIVGGVVSWVARALGSAIDRAEAVMAQSRDELEQRVRARTDELSALNRELESFSYSVSHDLRAPLRHVAGFAALLQKRAGPGLDDESRRHLDTISDAAKRMGRLIDDLLTLSRTTRSALDKRTVSLDALVREAKSEIEAHATGRRIEWRIQDPLPQVKVDPGLFRLVLINLLSNAVKYTSQRAVAEIEVGSERGANGETILFIKDNGVGFDMQYAHKLFGVFQRLHRAEEFEGTGIGLANVHRIVRRHGGRTWADSGIGRGATFYVALPTS